MLRRGEPDLLPSFLGAGACGYMYATLPSESADISGQLPPYVAAYPDLSYSQSIQ